MPNATKRPRDSQRSKVYAAENAVFPRIHVPEPALREIAACQRWVDTVCAAPWFRRRWGLRDIRVTNNRGKGGSRASGSIMHMGVIHRNPAVLCHELAHCLAPRDARHNPLYTRTYLELVRFVIGRETYEALKAAFKAHRVKVAPRRTVLDGNGVARIHPRKAARPAGNVAALEAWRAREKVKHQAQLAAEAHERVIDQYAPVFTKLAADEPDPYAPVWPEPRNLNKDIALALANGC